MTQPRLRTLVGCLLAAIFLAALVYATARESGVRCEICLDFGPGRACRAASARDRDQAIDQARATACAVLARGVTEAFACQRSVPASIHCDR